MDRLQQHRTADSRHYGAASEIGAENWALLSSIVATCRLNDVNPVAYLTETLTAIIDGHPQSQIEDLMPWRFRKASTPSP
ncbi:transposase domain-containing protein [Bradyrhizobium sp. CSA207]|uniref:transposase domain-containing protein n=1 Tax=Bradyrhizobium sp. CSA207 TaxID=2698826 RepID=UPI0023B1C2E4|nr:transposase domain-containing protein [Bradyrhizobium sp. CSA207]